MSRKVPPEQLPFQELIQYLKQTGKSPVYAWEARDAKTGRTAEDAMRDSYRDNRGMLYRPKAVFKPGTTVPTDIIPSRIGLPNHRYTEWDAWYRDYLKISLRVHYPPAGVSLDQYRLERYQTRKAALLADIAAERGCARTTMELSILDELYEEIEMLYRVGEEVLVAFEALQALGLDNDPAVIARMGIVIENALSGASQVEVQIDGCDVPHMVNTAYVARHITKSTDEF